MKKRSILLFVVFALGVGSILSLSLSELSILQSPEEFVGISVIVRDTDNSVWAVARQGMEQAAADLNAEVRFLTPATQNSVSAQRNLLEREVENGADAVILAPADVTALSDDVSSVARMTSIVTLESDMSQSGAVACISPDNAALGEALATEAMKSAPEGGRFILVHSNSGSTGINERVQSAQTLLKQAGFEVINLAMEGEEYITWEEPPDGVICFEAYILQQLMAQFKTMEMPPMLYGTGTTAEIAAGLEQGTVTVLAAQNEFSAGYIAVEQAVLAATNRAIQPTAPLTFSILCAENMYEIENQKLLFPVTR